MTLLRGATTLTPQPRLPLQEPTKCSGDSREIQPPTKFTFKRIIGYFFFRRGFRETANLFFLLEKVYFEEEKKEIEEKVMMKK